jgi:hypothetical protein
MTQEHDLVVIGAGSCFLPLFFSYGFVFLFLPFFFGTGGRGWGGLQKN